MFKVVLVIVSVVHRATWIVLGELSCQVSTIDMVICAPRTPEVGCLVDDRAGAGVRSSPRRGPEPSVKMNGITPWVHMRVAVIVVLLERSLPDPISHQSYAFQHRLPR